MSNIIVTMLLVVRNSEDTISSVLHSLLQQGYDHSEFEIIIVDGESEDLTIKIAEKILAQSPTNYMILNNPNRSLSSGWNIGIRHAIGDYIIRPDAHSELMNNYVRNGIQRLMNDPSLGGVGGVLRTRSKGFIGGVIAEVLCNPAGVGPSLFRTGVREDTYTDTAVFAIYRRFIFERCGYLDETLKRNQDVDFHKRLVARGFKLLTSPSMVANYYSRETFRGFVTQGFQNGFWAITSGEFFLRHLAPLGFVCMLLIFSIIRLELIVFILICYFSVTTFFYITRNRFDIVKLLFFNICILSLHIAYGLGSMLAIINNTKKYI